MMRRLSFATVTADFAGVGAGRVCHGKIDCIFDAMDIDVKPGEFLKIAGPQSQEGLMLLEN